MLIVLFLYAKDIRSNKRTYMRVFKRRTVNYLYFFYRLACPIIDPVKFITGVYGYVWYIRDIIQFKKLDPKAKILNINLFPILHEKTPLSFFDAHYFYQQLWAFEWILRKRPKLHVDIGSTYSMSGYISKIVKAKFIDLRPINTNLKNLTVEKGNILSLINKDNSIMSLSCLHVAEHIGLGRYGDSIDPRGTEKACRELARVLARGGYLYFSLPIGKDRVCFNGHRIHSVKTILQYFRDLKLIEYSVVDDQGKFHENVDYTKYPDLEYGCGMFMFTK